MEYFLSALKNYAKFDGRARRAEYWYFALFFMLIYLGLTIICGFIGIPELAYLFYIGCLVPAIAVGVRRMHDVGKSGWFLLIPIYSFILAVTEGDKGPNEYGPDPKDPTAVGNNGSLDSGI